MRPGDARTLECARTEWRIEKFLLFFSRFASPNISKLDRKNHHLTINMLNICDFSHVENSKYLVLLKSGFCKGSIWFEVVFMKFYVFFAWPCFELEYWICKLNGWSLNSDFLNFFTWNFLEFFGFLCFFDELILATNRLFKVILTPASFSLASSKADHRQIWDLNFESKD